MSTQPFKLDRRAYIAFVRRADVKTTPDDPIQLGIYAPGTVCLYWFDHDRGAGSFYYGFLVWARDCWGLVGFDCAKEHFHGANPQPWETALDQRHPLVGTGLGVNWRNRTLRKYWRLVPLMGMILQVEPNKDILRGYLNRATTRKRTFTPPETKTLQDILRERGSDEHTADHVTRDQKIKSYLKVIKARRDLAFRLARLAALDLDADDETKVASLQAFNTQRRGKRISSLTDKQVRMVGAIEAQYLDQRIEVADALAQALAREFGLKPPRR